MRMQKMRAGDIEYFKEVLQDVTTPFDFLLGLVRKDLERQYVGTYSIVLLAVVDSDYKFVVVDVGAYGKQSDGGVLQNSRFGKRLDEGRLQLPRDLPLPGTVSRPHACSVGDEAFQLRTDFLRPYPGRLLDDCKRIFNYRLSRARRCAENASGILVTRWRILERKIGERPENAEVMVKALCVLHNFLMMRQHADDADSVSGIGERRSGLWRQNLVQPPLQLARTQARNFAQMARYVRDLFTQYFWSAAGSVAWQRSVLQA
ncbi:hypothetical protein HPB48_004790 [Haemaphysalis longicornis]|uniref:DDE Tnp4 domain-containing protein n=1 Tax=Haemaphysalis longicornis TaxID=44386 RepID=A0A9J6FCC6_HAELO|nr:hypothetical protein HPB48_004790 [Haemaphysalis longicornis]